MTEFRSVEEQLQEVLRDIEPLEPFPIGLMESRGCVLAEDVTAPWPLPAFDTASVDGYAVHALQTSLATTDEPCVLRVIDSIRSGESSSRALIPGTAIRVSAGSALPDETESVVPVEHTNGGDEEVAIFRPAKYGQSVRRCGEDVQAGNVVAPAGTAIDARVLGLLAAVGRSQVEARPRPRVVIVSIGSELLEIGAPLQPGRVPDTNGIMLAAAIAECGGVAYRVGPISDEPEVIQRVLSEQLVRAEPDKAAAARVDIGLIRGGVLGADAAVQAVAGDDEIGVGIRRVILHIGFKDELDALFFAPCLQDVQQALAPDAAETVATRAHHLATDVDLDVVPVVEGVEDLRGALGVGALQVAQRLVREDHAPAEGVVRPVALHDGDVV